MSTRFISLSFVSYMVIGFAPVFCSDFGWKKIKKNSQIIWPCASGSTVYILEIVPSKTPPEERKVWRDAKGIGVETRTNYARAKPNWTRKENWKEPEHDKPLWNGETKSGRSWQKEDREGTENKWGWFVQINSARLGNRANLGRVERYETWRIIRQLEKVLKANLQNEQSGNAATTPLPDSPERY